MTSMPNLWGDANAAMQRVSAVRDHLTNTLKTFLGTCSVTRHTPMVVSTKAGEAEEGALVFAKQAAAACGKCSPNSSSFDWRRGVHNPRGKTGCV